MNPHLGVAFIVIGGIFYTARLFGFFTHRKKYKLVPAFLIGNGIGFFVPAHIFADGLIIGGLLMFVDQMLFGKRRQTKS